MINLNDKRSKIVIAGGTGALGKLLADFYVAMGWMVIVLTRSAWSSVPAIRYVTWDGKTLDTWADELTGAAAVVNLAGRSINTRFTANRKQEILDSRIDSTAVIGEAISICKSPPKVWINAGGIAIFGSSSALKTEADVPDGTDFLSLVSRQWEQVFSASMTPATRKIQLRISSVLLSGRGILSPLVKLTKLGLGGTVGSGNQYVSWIHNQDFVKLVDWLIVNETIVGIVHASSPNPVTNRDFMQALRKKLRIPFGIRNPTWSTKLGAWLIGTQPELALLGHRVVSGVLGDKGFVFDFPELPAALRNLML
ncbi:TIGR01777 family oxidoreductase [Parapedobacter defluvii]|uniref:TIGR01777 family oxidoreductase n=1 Tax=Parapedobacter defluvii TaxID=2045106 RepID=UPI0033409394